LCLIFFFLTHNFFILIVINFDHIFVVSFYATWAVGDMYFSSTAY